MDRGRGRVGAGVGAGSRGQTKVTWMNQFLLLKNYELVILRLLEISVEDCDLVDYYWTQLLSISLHLSKKLISSYLSISILSLYQQCLLSIALQYPVLGMRLIWYFLGIIDDYQKKNKRINEYQYTSALAILIQYEIYLYGGAECLLSHHSFPFPSSSSPFSSASSSSPSASASCEESLSPFQSLLYPSRIQKLELWKEFQTLLQTRQLIQQTNRYELLIKSISSSASSSSTQGGRQDQQEQEKKEQQSVGTPSSSTTTTTISCLDIYQKGFAQILLSKPTLPFLSSIHDSECSFTITSADWYSIRNPIDSSSASCSSSSFHKQQFRFMTKLFSFVDSLRFISDFRQREAKFLHDIYEHFLLPSPLPSSSTLEGEGGAIEGEAGGGVSHEMKDIGYDPTTIASEPLYRIIHLFVEECKIYKTKERTPTRIVFGMEIDEMELKRRKGQIEVTSLGTGGGGRGNDFDLETGSNSSNEVTFYHPNHHQHNLINGDDDDEGVAISTAIATAGGIEGRGGRRNETQMISETINHQVALKLNQTLVEMKQHFVQVAAPPPPSSSSPKIKDKTPLEINNTPNLIRSSANPSQRTEGFSLFSSVGSTQELVQEEVRVKEKEEGEDKGGEIMSSTTLSSSALSSSLSTEPNLIESIYGVDWGNKKKSLIAQYLSKRGTSRPQEVSSRIEEDDTTTPLSSSSSLSSSSVGNHFHQPLNLHHPQYLPLPPPSLLHNSNTHNKEGDEKEGRLPMDHPNDERSSLNDSLMSSSVGSLSIWPLYDVRSYILKTNDDLRQDDLHATH
jgi:hypothetical protein